MTRLWIYLVILMILASLIDAKQGKGKCKRRSSKSKCQRRKNSFRAQHMGKNSSDYFTKTEWVTHFTTLRKPQSMPSDLPAGQTVTDWSTKVVTMTRTSRSDAEPTKSSAPPMKQANVPEGLPSNWREQMLALVNEERRKRPDLKLQDVQMLEGLNEMAQAHSQYQFDIQDMTHKDPKSMGQRVDEKGIKWSGIAENVAFNYPGVKEVMAGWVKSPGHYANIVGNYTHAGFGVVGRYWTQNYVKVKSG